MQVFTLSNENVSEHAGLVHLFPRLDEAPVAAVLCHHKLHLRVGTAGAQQLAGLLTRGDVGDLTQHVDTGVDAVARDIAVSKLVSGNKDSLYTALQQLVVIRKVLHLTLVSAEILQLFAHQVKVFLIDIRYGKCFCLGAERQLLEQIAASRTNTDNTDFDF